MMLISIYIDGPLEYMNIVIKEYRNATVVTQEERLCAKKLVNTSINLDDTVRLDTVQYYFKECCKLSGLCVTISQYLNHSWEDKQ